MTFFAKFSLEMGYAGMFLISKDLRNPRARFGHMGMILVQIRRFWYRFRGFGTPLSLCLCK